MGVRRASPASDPARLGSRTGAMSTDAVVKTSDGCSLLQVAQDGIPEP
jgi:hypothetical protein